MARSAFFHGKRVSLAHKTMLREAERRGIVSRINQGRRTIAEQTVFWLAWLRFKAGGPPAPLAARPWGGAPHIKWGRGHHALDIDDGVSDRVAAFYRRQGVPAVFNVAGEPWHIDFPDLDALQRAAASLRERGGLLATLKPGTRHDDVRHARFLLLEGGSKLRIPRTQKRHYGRKMAREVRRIQRNNGLRPDGVIGPKTWRRLRIRADRRD